MPRKLTQEQFIERCVRVHGDKYDYSSTVYTYMMEKVTVVCKEHGEFVLSANDHQKGTGCPRCAHNFPLTTESFISKAKEVHSNKYLYTDTCYEHSKKKVVIECPEHGKFKQLAAGHLRGQGCPKCESKQLTSEDFVQRLHRVFGDEFDYSLVDYKSHYDKVTLVCPKHGTFEKMPGELLNGIGCQRCKINRSEQQWLDSLNIDTLERGKRLYIGEKYYIVDGYDPVTNTVYEFHGDYWHGNPDVYDLNDINQNNKKTFRELLIETQDRTSCLRNNGYNVVEMWENTWKEKKCES